ncbi:hypothetical protein RclHR1_09940003 [Rhizophagus clarus]|nr:hypothetical protein RclHR1_09940003 [Rhizophagus clarus]
MSEPDINYSRPTSSLRHRNDDVVVDQKVPSMISPTSAKRYATYELNWNNLDYSNDLDQVTNSAQAARWSLPNSPPPPTHPPLTTTTTNNPTTLSQEKKQPRHSKVRKSISPIIINTRKSDKNENEPQSPFGGITVTTVKVVEILHSPTEKDDDFNDLKFQQRHSRHEHLNEDPVGIITSEHSKERKMSKQRITLPPSSNSIPRLPLPSSQNKSGSNNEKKNQDSIILNQKKRSTIINSQKVKGNKNLKKPEMIIPKEMAFIDPRLLAINKSLIRTPSLTISNRNRKSIKRGGSFYKKKLPPKDLEFGSTSNPIYSNDPTDMEADLPPIKHQIFPWLPGPPKPPQLLHASLVPLPRVNRVAIDHDSHNIKNNTLDNNFTSVNLKRKSKLNSNRRLSRVNSQRRRTSIIEPDPNRASLVFRRQILEESLMMSFGGTMMGGVQQQPTLISKQPIRRKTKKGSNAKLEDREIRRERRRKERLEKRLAKEAQNFSSDNNHQIEGKNIKNENNVKGLYMGPQPPPRKQSQDKPIISSLQKPKNNALSLLSSPPDRRLVNSNVNSSLEHSTDEPPPFPTHLARSTPFFEHTSNKERSKRKQQPFSPLTGQPISSPISPISNNSPSNSESKELIDDDVSQHETINSDETSSIHQLPSPNLTPNKSQKIGKNILGLFNKQTTKDPTSPPISQISSPILHPTHLSLQSPPITPITLSSSTPPQSPPLSPRTLKIPQQLLGKSRRGIENGIGNPVIQNQEKKKKMEQFEALIANSEISSSKKPISGKIKALTTAITTVASSATSSASSSINTSFEKRKKSADGTPYHTPRHSSESYKSEGKESEKKNGPRRGSSDRSSLTNSLADSVRYNTDERSELGPSDDGVIRVTLTPEVCR